MRTLRKNKQKLKYALQDKEIPIYEEYIDEDGNKMMLETGEYEPGYSEPIEFLGNIAFSGGETTTQEFGVDIGSYDAVLLLSANELPITETSLIWYKSEIGYKDDIQTIVDGHTADFAVKAIKPSKNFVRVFLGAVTK